MYANDDKRNMSANDDTEVVQADARPRNAAEIRSAIDDLKDFQRSHTLGGLSIRQMIEEGRNRCQRS